MVFAHGFGCDQNMWRMVAPTFADDHQVVLFDFVGAGGSDLTAWNPERYASLHGYARDILEIVEELDLTDVVIVGHSVGAIIALLAVAQAPERFSGLVLVSPSPRFLDDPPYRGGFTEQDIEELLEALDSNYLGWSATVAPMIMGNPERPDLAAELTNSFCRTDPDIARHFARVTFTSDNRADLGRVDVPTLVLQVRHDALAPVEVGTFVHEAVRDSRLTVLETSGHCPHLSAPDDVVAAIREFLAAAVPSRS
ncbi:alpha/beta hydrolase [Actinomycetospora sp. TBRC 11914]|nr:alpha/beta hydrolase [Actinomycetospora sp. TBRC 11914]NMO90360.1 alpha/beta hydrolase [Actinomycetospora sp. TBRC 11914]